MNRIDKPNLIFFFFVYSIPLGTAQANDLFPIDVDRGTERFVLNAKVKMELFLSSCHVTILSGLFFLSFVVCFFFYLF